MFFCSWKYSAKLGRRCCKQLPNFSIWEKDLYKFWYYFVEIQIKIIFVWSYFFFLFSVEDSLKVFKV